jgi:methylmalonyl-CoA mutase C-terminal domain/subunit
MDAHWRGAITVARLLRDAGYEVIYLGHATPEQVAATARDEDVDFVGLSSLSGNHNTEARKMLDALRQLDLANMKVVLGGTIPSKDAAQLMNEGVFAVFGPGTPGSEIVERLAEGLSVI